MHAELCVAAPPPPAALVRWLIRSRFDGVQDFFSPDVAAYADALGPAGLRRFRAELDQTAAELPPEPDEQAERASWQEQLADPERYDAIDQHRRVRLTLSVRPMTTDARQAWPDQEDRHVTMTLRKHGCHIQYVFGYNWAAPTCDETPFARVRSEDDLTPARSPPVERGPGRPG